jgi:hypothetical protein
MRAPPATADRVRLDQAEQHKRKSRKVLHAAQPGYADSIVADDGQRLIAVNLCRT